MSDILSALYQTPTINLFRRHCNNNNSTQYTNSMISVQTWYCVVTQRWSVQHWSCSHVHSDFSFGQEILIHVGMKMNSVVTGMRENSELRRDFTWETTVDGNANSTVALRCVSWSCNDPITCAKRDMYINTFTHTRFEDNNYIMQS